MPINYKVERSIGGLTQAELNTLGQSNWDLQVILEEDIGYQYIFVEAADDIEYQVPFAVFGLTEAELQDYGDDDWEFVTALTPNKSLGTYYYFKRVVGGGPPT